MNLDDLLKSIREENGDSKGGKVDPDKLIQRRTYKAPAKFSSQSFRAPSIKPTPSRKLDADKLAPTETIQVGKDFLDKIDELIQVIKEDNELEKDRQDALDKEKARERRQTRENRIEVGKIFSGFTKGFKRVTGQFNDIINTVIRFLAFTVLGGIIKFLFDFLKDPKNKGFLKNVQKFFTVTLPQKFEEAKQKLGEIIKFFKETVPKIEAFAENFRQLLTRFPFLGELFKTKEEKKADQRRREQAEEDFGPFGILKGGGMLPFLGTDTVPAMLTPGEFVMSRGAVNMFGVDTMMAMNKAGGGTNRPKFGLVSGFSGGGFTRDVTKLLENYEGLRLNAYPDPASGGEPITIGVGATRYPPGFRFGRSKVMLGDTITKEEAYMIKDYDVKRHTKIAKDRVGHEMWPKLPENVKFALISKAFNYGTVYNSTLRELDKGVESGDYSALAAHYRNVLAKHNNGINSWRRNDEAGIIASGKSKRSGMTFSTSLSAPPITPPPMPSTIPDGSFFGPGFDSNDRAQSERLNLINLMYKNRAKQSTNRFSGVDLDFIFKPIRQFLGIDTPNAPTSTKIIVLPAVKQTAQQSGTQVDNEIPNFRISSGVKMRGLVGKALGIEDLVS